MADQIRDMIPYFKTWLVFATSSFEDIAKNKSTDFKELQDKLESAERYLERAKLDKCQDLVEEFAAIVIRLEDILEEVNRKRKKMGL